jgi:hypothetical protein
MARKSVKIPTYSGGNRQPRQNFTLPVQSGQALQGVVTDITSYANKVADNNAVQTAYQKGLDTQQKALEAGDTTYVANYNPASLTGEAFQKGAKIAYVSSRTTEYETELKNILLKTPSDPEAYSLAANEYKTEFLSTISSDLQSEFSLKFDAYNNNYFNQANANKIVREKEQQIVDTSNRLDIELGKLEGAIGTDGLTSPQMSSSLEEVNLILNGFTSQAMDLKPAAFDAKKKLVRQTLQLSVLKNAYLNATVEEREKLIADIKTGNVGVLQELQETYGQDLLPLTSQLTAKEITLYGDAIDDYKDAIIKGNASEISIAKKAHENFISNKKNGFELDNEFDYSTLEGLGVESTDITNYKTEEAKAYEIGRYVSLARKTGIIDVEKIETQIRLETNEIRKRTDLNDTEKQQLIDINDEKLKLVIAEKEKKQQALEKGEILSYVVDVAQESFDLTTEEGIDRAVELSQQYFPYNYQKIKFSSDFTEANLDTLLNQEDVNTAMGLALNYNEKYGKYTAKVITDAITPAGKTIANAEGNVALLTFFDLVQSGNPADISNAKELWSSIKERKNNEDVVNRLFPDDIKDNLSNLELDFSTNYAPKLSGDTFFGTSVFESYKNIYYRSRAGGKTHDIAKADADAFITQTYQEVTFSNEQSMIIPKYENAQTFLTDGNDMLEHPGDYNIIVGNGDTLNDFTKDVGNYKFAYEGGQLVLKTDNGFISAIPKQIMPSGANDLIYSDVMQSPGNKDNVQSVDVEPTWQLDTPKNWYQGWKDSTAFTKEIEIDVMGVAEGQTTTTIDKKTNDIAVEFAQHFTETMIQTDENEGETGQAYEDKFVVSMAAFGSIDQTILNGISLAAKDGNLDGWMLDYMAKFDYTNKLNDKGVKEYVLAEWKKINKETPPTSKNNEATIMTPLQTLASIIRRAPVQKTVTQIVDNDELAQTP